MIKKAYSLWVRASSAGSERAASELDRKANRISNQFILLYCGVMVFTSTLFTGGYVLYHLGKPAYMIYPIASWLYTVLLIVFFWGKNKSGLFLIFDMAAYFCGLIFITLISALSGKEPWFFLFLVPLAYLPFFLVRLHYALRVLGNLLCYLCYVLMVRYVFSHSPLLPLTPFQEELSFWLSIISLPVLFITVTAILYFQNKQVISDFISNLIERSATTRNISAERKAKITITQIEILTLGTIALVFIPILAVVYPVLLGVDYVQYINYDIIYGSGAFALLILFQAILKWRNSLSISLQGGIMSLALVVQLLLLTAFSGIQAYLFLVPTICALFFFIRVIRPLHIFAIVFVLIVAFLFGLDIQQNSKPIFPLSDNIIRFASLFLPVLILFLTAAITYLFARESKIAEEGLETEKERSDRLLLNILPVTVAEELKEKGTATPVRYESVSVLFTDFVGFSIIAEKISSEDLIDELDKCFSYFDAVTKRYKLEKIKTIGDSYMLAGGLPEQNTTHAIDCCLAALEIQAFMQQMREIKVEQGFDYWQLRLGIHSGPLVAGVIGEMKFAYDVFGDTVNSASRMESSGIADKINISKATYQLVKEFFHCTFRGQVAAKHKGMVDMYIVDGIHKEMSVQGEGRVPNDKFHELYEKLT